MNDAIKDNKIPRWSVGIVRADTFEGIPAALSDARCILTTREIHDRISDFVADPFLIRHNNSWFLFVEVFDRLLLKGVIGCAQSSDGTTWRYLGTVLEEPFHLSYPYVFAHENEIYMIPETRRAKAIRLYRAKSFPGEWEFVTTLLEGKFKDASIVYFQNRWWIFAGQGAYGLSAFHSKSLLGPWKRHLWPRLYLQKKAGARPGGRIIEHKGSLIRFGQDSVGHYGHKLRAFKIERLSPFLFKEREISPAPFLFPEGDGWRSLSMHHCDPLQLPDGSWMAAVDGEGIPKA